MKEPIIILPLSQYEALKEKVKSADELSIHLTGAIISAASPALLSVKESVLPLDGERLRNITTDIAIKVIKRLGLDGEHNQKGE